MAGVESSRLKCKACQQNQKRNHFPQVWNQSSFRVLESMGLFSAYKIKARFYVRTGRSKTCAVVQTLLTYTKTQETHFCRLESAPQKIALSGRVLPLSSGLTTFMYTSWPKYQVSRFWTRKFHMPALSRNTRIAVQAPGNTCNQVDTIRI